MAIQFPPLPYSSDALEPSISKNTMDYHYGKHHRKYVSTLNGLIEDSSFDKMTLEDIIVESAHSHPVIFNNAAQAWNHNFYWNCMKPNASGEPNDDTLVSILKAFDTFENFKVKFVDSAKSLFGSGWTWLVKNPDGRLSIHNLKNADTPIMHDQMPILACDVWEHAYYLDYQNERARYLENFWRIVNWNFVEDNMRKDLFLRIGKLNSEAKWSQLI
jgi:Fe-Mn family superoxide dismutase